MPDVEDDASPTDNVRQVVPMGGVVDTMLPCHALQGRHIKQDDTERLAIEEAFVVDAHNSGVSAERCFYGWTVQSGSIHVLPAWQRPALQEWF